MAEVFEILGAFVVIISCLNILDSRHHSIAVGLILLFLFLHWKLTHIPRTSTRCDSHRLSLLIQKLKVISTQ